MEREPCNLAGERREALQGMQGGAVVGNRLFGIIISGQSEIQKWL